VKDIILSDATTESIRTLTEAAGLEGKDKKVCVEQITLASTGLSTTSDFRTFVTSELNIDPQKATALFEGVTVLFLAQVFGIHLSLGVQLVVVIMSVLTAVGSAGVPSGSIPLLVIVLAMVNIPPEGIAIILGADRLLDMCRTVLNVTGDITCAAYVARSEGFELKQ